MQVKSFELEIDWPSDITIFSLREFLIEEIKAYGDPLRWAITSVSSSNESFCIRRLLVEAVVIIPEASNSY